MCMIGSHLISLNMHGNRSPIMSINPTVKPVSTKIYVRLSISNPLEALLANFLQLEPQSFSEDKTTLS